MQIFLQPQDPQNPQRRTSSRGDQVQTEGHASPHPHTCLGPCYIERPVQNVKKLMTQSLHSPTNWSRQTVKTVKDVFWRGESDEVSCIVLTAIVLIADQLWNDWQIKTLYFNMKTYYYPPPHTHTRIPWKIPNTFPHPPGNRGFSDGNESVMPVWKSLGWTCLIRCARPDRSEHS